MYLTAKNDFIKNNFKQNIQKKKVLLVVNKYI